MKNAGNLPARKVSWFVRIKESPDGEETDFPIENSKGKIVIVPKADITKTGTRRPSPRNAGNFDRAVITPFVFLRLPNSYKTV